MTRMRRKQRKAARSAAGGLPDRSGPGAERTRTRIERPVATVEPEPERREEEVDESIDESFPASDPPSFTPHKLTGA